ncbi:lipopolysaccharide assembly LapA domain-containing protein [Amorphoplanes digitatis]|uniref:Putative integral membrane protein n=1 Tax=Actinoplanes digitatis TaxID=1868 RepID=A0A7W7HVP1_9ACTN|nr:lipopolysaccharide assembly protein LapA domain-containing protein [Actinoplanes digitatis]MBB4761553.1 putative integral membrane protein [Actinoplanes digitatis]GID90661.1 hypothetical protein Adi01nite_00730 [Actinoplanes digitatis]
MSDDQIRTPTAPVDPTASASTSQASTGSPTGQVPRTRAGSAWFGICAAALLSVVLIIFIGQNTGNVQVNFLGMEGSLPLALALLIAAVGTAILIMAVGTVRIAQLRRRLSHQR